MTYRQPTARNYSATRHTFLSPFENAKGHDNFTVLLRYFDQARAGKWRWIC